MDDRTGAPAQPMEPPEQNPSAVERLRALSPAKRALLQKLLDDKRQNAAPSPIARRPPGEPAPLSHGQKRLWFLDQLEGASATYQMGGALRLDGALDVGALERALAEIVQRHEVLRTRFVTAQGGPVAVAAREVRCPLERVSLEAISPELREAEVQRLATQHLRRPFALSSDVLLRTTLLELGAKQHVLLLAVHHILSDGWSIAVFFRELTALYAAHERGEPSPLPALPIQYADYADWQQRALVPERLAPALDAWRTLLRGAPPVLELPFDRPRPPVQTFRGRTHRFLLDPELKRPLTELARETGTTLFMVLLAGFGVVLSRYAGREDLVVGSPVANRPRQELEPLIGFFVNTLPLRVDLTGRPTVRELLARVRAMCLGAYMHQEVPFELLVEELRPERNLSHSPLFQVMFALQNAQSDVDRLGELEVSTFDPDTGTAMFDWTLFVQETKTGLAAAVEYNTDLFDEATVVRFASHYRTLLAELCSGLDRRVSELSLLDPSERRRCLVAWAPSALSQEGPATLLASFAARAEARPGAVAVRFEGESLTYGSLHERALSLAAHLRRLGVRPGERVAVFLERTPDLLVALLGVLASGAAYVPLDPAYPRERLAFMLEDSRAGVVITQESLLGLLPEGAAQRVVYDRDRADIARGVVEAWPAPGPDDGAYVIYTSGSTGRPKGVAINHGALGYFLAAMAREPGLGTGDRLLAVTTVSFDIAALELYLPLWVGASVELVSREVAADGLRLCAALEQSAATVLQATPATYWALLEAGLVRGSLRQLLCGGEALPVELARRLLRLGVDVYNVYGPTETTVWSSLYRLPPDFGMTPGAESCPIGRPLAGTQMVLLDHHGHPVPIGVPGELYIGGPGLAVGYLNRPGLTAERFVPNPFDARPGGRLYRTGDLARHRADGTIEFVGRVDNQVKLRGYRIELGEIEATIDQHSAVQASVVVCRPGRLEEKELAAYFVARPADAAAASERQALAVQRASEWQKIWDDTYGEQGHDRQELDLAGWKSSYTGDAVPAEQMRSWIDETARRILRLRPRRVLEVGCGTGLILQRLLPHVQAYVGADLSSVVLERLATRLPGPLAARVRLACLAADDLRSLGERDFDVIVLSSVVQYFPSLEYTQQVLEQALALLAPGGAIFVGDVRSLPHLRAQHASVQLFRASGAQARAAVRAAVERQLGRERELALHPRAFAVLAQRLGGIRAVEVQLKRGRDDNEMNQFRYDVVLRAAAPGAVPVDDASVVPLGDDGPSSFIDAQTFDDPPLAALRRRLTRAPVPEVLVVGGLVNGRVERALRILRWIEGAGDEPTVGDLRRSLAEQPTLGIDPDEVGQLGEALGYDVEIAWSGADPRSRFDVLLRRGRPASPAERAAVGWPRWAPGDDGPLANDPLAASAEGALIDSVRAHVAARLPAYMVPSQWLRLDAFPLTANGKVDRRALRPPDPARGVDVEVEPRTDDEQRLAHIWAEALRIERVGVTADFFQLGGHSLLATQVVSRIREAFQVELPLRALFEARTIEQLARQLRSGEHARPTSPVVRALHARGPVPLSFSQRRLWFLDRLEGPSPTYNLFGSLRLRGDLDVPALERALSVIAERHEILRMRFADVDGDASQVVSDSAWGPLELERIAGGSSVEREAQARAFAARVAFTPFDLAAGPLLRAALGELGPRDRVLVIAVHHIVADEWSIRIFLHELSQVYEAVASGRPSPLPPLALQYADYAAWQRAWLDGPVREVQLDYWRAQLSQAPRSLALRTDRKRPPVQRFRGRAHAFEVPRSLTARLRRLGNEHGTTLFQTLLTAFAALLSRYTGERDIVIGTPIANRTRRELEPLIGFFVNTLALRVDLGEDPDTRELLRRVRAVCLDAQEHQDIPFEAVVDELKVARDLARSPLFQVMFILQNAPLSGLALGSVEVSDFPIESSIARFDLTLSIEDVSTPPSPGQDAEVGLRGAFEYDTDLFDSASIERLTEGWLALLDAMVSHPQAPLSELRILSEGERQRVLQLSSEVWRESDGSPRSVTELFRRQAQRTPDAEAVAFADVSLSYAQLARRAEQLSARLAREGIGRGMLVGLCLDDPLEQLLGLLGILGVGAAYLPLDTAHPSARIAFMLSDSRAPFVLTTRALADDLPAATCRVLCLDADPASESESLALTPALPVTPGPDELAYVVYTSGSTGQPKGIGITHGAIVRLASAQRELYGIDARSRIAQLVSVSFDVAASDVVMALGSGAALVLTPSEARAPGPLLGEHLARHGVTHLQLPASILARLPWRPLPELRAVIVGGESSAQAVLERWRAGRRLFNAYGPTEATVAASAGEIRGEDDAVHIGRPLAGARVYLLDQRLEPVPLGVAGEIFIGGSQLARGYLHRPALTAERFLPDPHATEPGSRMYRTGDLARYLADGRIEFLGRTDHQIKLHGNRIELGEIESTLASHPRVLHCAVLLRETRPGQPRLSAYVVLAGASVDAADELRRHLQDRLPGPMIPGEFIALPVLPLTPHGKVDRDALASIEPGVNVSTSRSFVAPRTPVEVTLAAIWKQLLGVEAVGVFDNFFALGGDSIVTIQVVSRARQAGLGLTVKQLFQHQTVAELAAVARAEHGVTAPEEVVSGPLPLSPIQRWFFAGAPRNPHHFNQSVFLQASADLDARVLADALKRLVQRHDMLRARFYPQGPVWEQALVDAADALSLTVEDAADAFRAGHGRAALEQSAERWQTTLDLTEGPLGRAVLYRCGGGEPDRLLLLLHHLVVDAVSWRILIEDLEQAYLQCARGGEATLGPKTTAFRSWSERLHAHAQSEAVGAELPYWLEVSAASATIPVDARVERAALETGSAATFTRSLDAETTHALLVLTPGAYRTQINDVLLAALGRSMGRTFGVRRLRIDLEGHGRQALFADLDLSRTVGWFTTVFPVVLVATPDEPLEQSLTATKESLRQVPEHGLHHGLLRYLGADSARSLLGEVEPAEVTFNYLGRFDVGRSGDTPGCAHHAGAQPALFSREANESPGSPIGPHERRRYLLELNAWVSGGQLQMSFTHSPAVHHASTIERLAGELAAELQAIARHCGAAGAGGYTASDFPLARLSAGALGQLFATFGRSVEDAYPLSPVQQGMLFHAMYDRASAVYCQQLVARLSGDVRADRLERAFASVVERHPALRSAFVPGLHEPLQVVLAEVTLPYGEHDYRQLAPAEQHRALEALLDGERRKGFDLARAPLARLQLVWLDTGAELVFTHHHLLLDGWSLAIVLAEVARIYEASLRDEPLELPRPRPYREYIAWLGRSTSSEAYWRDALAGFRATTRLGIEKHAGTASPPSHASSFGERRRVLSTVLTRQLGELARVARVTLGVVVQAAWSMLLARYSGERDVVFGATVSGRPASLDGVEAMVGLFITTVPVRETPTPELTLTEYLTGVQARQVAREPHVHSALVDIQAWSDLPPGAPLFDTLVVFENYPVGATEGQEPSRMGIGEVRAIERTHYPFTLFVSPGDTLGLSASYDPSVYEHGAVTALLAHLENLLVAMALGPHTRLSRLALLSPLERDALLAASRRTERDDSGEPLVHAAIAAQAARTPDAIALAQGDRVLTYRELQRRALELAARLRGLGVGREVIVGLYLERSLDLVVALLGVLHAGGTYLPLDTEFPAERIGFMLRDSRAHCVLTQTRLESRLPACAATIICLDASPPSSEDMPQPMFADATVASGPLDAAYVLYTSGSTGRPKGVTIAHASLRNFLLSMREAPGMRPDDVLLSVTTISFDIAGLELLLPLSVGARVELLPDGAARDGGRIAGALRRSGATVMQATPTTWRLLLEEEWGSVRLKRALCGGEALPRALAERLNGRGLELWNLYGPTETTIWSTRERVAATPEGAADASCRIGYPIANTGVYVLDGALELVPAGATGELFIGGAGVARGYLGRPGLTAERFLPDPFSSRPGSRMYRTGDRVRHGEGGSLEFLGRMDNQIKLRGHRIELGEIEAVLVAHPELSNAAVVVRGHGGEAALVAYLVARSGLEPPDPELRAWLGERLPSYMSVSQFVWLASLPLTLNGKVDRARLPDVAPAPSPRRHAPPETPTELRLARIWREVLGVDELGVEDDFFHLGGHSLRATRVVAQIRATFQISLPLAYFFDHPTIAAIAAAIDRELGERARPAHAARAGEEDIVL